MDKSGNLYGTTWAGGLGMGTVFELTPTGTEKVLYSFGSQSGDGGYPYASLIRDAKGNLYGTTESYGGPSSCGTIFKVTPKGLETILYTFAGGTDGCQPIGSLVADKSGNLYGTTQGGGNFGWGTVFKLTPTGIETVLHIFSGGGPDGAYPIGGLYLKGTTLYGTTFGGGANGIGIVFKMSLTGTEKVLYNFGASNVDPNNPYGSVVFDKLGNLYGTTQGGGADVSRICRSG